MAGRRIAIAAGTVAALLVVAGVVVAILALGRLLSGEDAMPLLTTAQILAGGAAVGALIALVAAPRGGVRGRRGTEETGPVARE